jgi:uncharacterized protein YukE
MSPKADADPESIEQFAKELKQYNAEIQSITQRLNGRFRQLSDSWRDQEFQKFEQQYEQTLRTINAFMRLSEAQIPLLKKKADILRAYLNR